MADSEIKNYLSEWKGRIEETLDRSLAPAGTRPQVIHEAMRYSVLAGGKRIRPILAIAAAQSCDSSIDLLLRQFCAIELIHTYSLVHDDLPAIDNDDLRRGRPTSHVIFGEAMAIMAGDALLTEAFVWLSEPSSVDPARQLAALAMVARAIDSRGMIGGQVADIQAERMEFGPTSRSEALDLLNFIHSNKTGKLLSASVELGGILGGASSHQMELFHEYGEAVGLAFQIVDDLLDLEEPAETLGKTAGKDLAQGKLTWPALLGVDEARRKTEELLNRAVATAGKIGGSVNYLGSLARYICERRS